VSVTSVLDETDIYREFAPPAELRGAVACVWIRRSGSAPVRVLPDACSDIIWRSGDGAFVAGPDTAAWLSRPGAGELILGARLLPGAGGAALAVPLSALRDQRVALAELALEPGDGLDAAADPRQALESLVALTGSLIGARRPDRAVQAAVVRLLDPSQRVESLAGELGFSERQLRRRFHDAVGYGPKTLQRVLRLRRFLARAADGASETGLATAALDAGYADQSHLGRECRALTGLSPRELVI
jgi:AraC-like DNA-binding protein